MKQMKPLRRVVITGMGAITPIGLTLEEITTSLREKRSGIKMIERFDTELLPVKFAGEITDFKPENYLAVKDVRRNDRFIQMCLAATDQAVANSGLKKEDFLSAGIAIGVGLGGLHSTEIAAVELANQGTKRISPFFVPSILANLASGQIGIRYSSRGPNYAISSACASGSQAIGQAYREIQAGRGDVWIAGGAEAPITPLSIAGFSASRALSKLNETPTLASRPFDQARDGFVLGEGAATLILESYDHAVARGTKILAEITGFGIASDGYHVTDPDPNGEGAYLAMMGALEDAEIEAREIDYVNAHATSTPMGDRIEAIALHRVLGESSANTFVSSTKSLTGHACGAAGALEAVFCLLMMNEKFLAPSINVENSDEAFRFRHPLDSDIDFAPKLVMNNSFGFGGINTSLIFSKGN